MRSIGIDKQTQRSIFSLIAGLLHLGNILFEDDDTDGQVGDVTEESKVELQVASKWLGVLPDELLTCMTKQSMHVSGSTIVKIQSKSQAIDKRDSFAKSIYSMIFNWLVDKINETISSAEVDFWGFVGLLDIYGFENFDNLNSYEQLLINYANEKMQCHFNKHIFQIEQAEYESECIDWSYINFNDNQSCIDLIDGKPFGKTGIFQTLDDSTGSLTF
jgi:myosin heavy subunit